MDVLMDNLIKKGHNIDNKRSELLKFASLENVVNLKYMISIRNLNQYM